MTPDIYSNVVPFRGKDKKSTFKIFSQTANGTFRSFNSDILSETNAWDYDKTENGDVIMDWTEKYIDKLDHEMSEIKSDLKQIPKEIDAAMKENLKSFREEYRHIDNQRVADMRDIKSDVNRLAEATTAERRNVQQITVAVVAMAIATILSIAGLVMSVYQNVSEIKQQQTTIINHIEGLKKNMPVNN